jgi:hypothetical protein
MKLTTTSSSLAAICAVALSILPSSVPAADKEPQVSWTDPARAKAEDADFSIQGEYGSEKEGATWGVQVVALGDGAFDAYLLEDGLPGIGWDRSKSRTKLSGQREADGAAITLKSEDAKTEATITDGQITVTRGDESLGSFERIKRKSPTLGAKAPDGAIVLFDGSNADAWENGKVEDGLLANANITTKELFGSYHLHLEFRTPYKPKARGQARGNSGVYHQGRYETQVLDAFGLEGMMNETGGIYSIAAPRLNACLPPLTWQTYDVDFTDAKFDDQGNKVADAKMTVRLNGVLIHENQELPKTTTAAPVKKITPDPGPIFIQAHGNPVFYRNIWIQRR